METSNPKTEVEEAPPQPYPNSITIRTKDGTADTLYVVDPNGEELGCLQDFLSGIRIGLDGKDRVVKALLEVDFVNIESPVSMLNVEAGSISQLVFLEELVSVMRFNMETQGLLVPAPRSVAQINHEIKLAEEARQPWNGKP